MTTSLGSATASLTVEVLLRIPDGTIIASADTSFDNRTLAIENASITIEGSHPFQRILLTNAALSARGTGIITAQSVSLSQGSVLTHDSATSRLQLQATDLTIDATSRIDVNGRGFLGGRVGENASDSGRTLGNTTTGGSTSTNGGSYGGLGGLVNSPLAPTYGAFDNPTDLGGGGGAANIFEPGGNGGGQIQISATTLTVNGVISANGTSGTGGGGGGSGGSIRITTSTLDGNGQIRAVGENSTKGGGGGGRIAITFQTMTLPQANLSVAGGTGNPGGAEGTIFLQPGGVVSSPPALASIEPTTGSSSGGTPITLTGTNFKSGATVTIGGNAATDVVVVSSTKITAVTPPGSVGTADVVVRDPISGVSGTLAGGFAYLNLIPDGTVIGPDDTTFDRQDISIEAGTVVIEGRHTFRSITLANGGTLTHPASTATAVPKPLELTIETRLSIDAASRIDVSGRGFLGGRSGDNAGDAGRTLGNLAGSGLGSGGSYGGLGGIKAGSTAAAAYGDLRQPMLLGSGGGGDASTNSIGGNGGASVRITTTDIEMNGAILANGTSGSGSNGGGGSGGSVLITAGKLIGTGRIEANGGGVEGPNSGTGGGGRIALLVDDLSGFDLIKMQARGGIATLTGGEHGGAGTIFVRRAGQTDGDLIVDNKGIGSAITPLRAVGFGKSTALTATVLTDTAATFPVPDPATGAMGLTGLRVNPNLEQAQTFQIADNTATTLTIAQGDLTTAAASGNLYLGVYTFDNITIAGGARVVTADAVSVRFSLSIDEASSLTSNIDPRDIPLGTLATARGTTQTLTATLPAPVGVPTRVVAVSGNPAIATITPTTVIQAGQSTVDLTVTAVGAGRTSFTITVGTHIQVLRVAVDAPPPEVPLTMASPVLAYVMGIPPGGTLVASPVLAHVTEVPGLLPTVLVGRGATAQPTLTLSAPAPAGGIQATAVSQNTAVATVASPIAIPEGAQTFTVQITGVAAGKTTVVVTAGSDSFLIRVLVDLPRTIPTVAASPVLVNVVGTPPGGAFFAPIVLVDVTP